MEIESRTFDLHVWDDNGPEFVDEVKNTEARVIMQGITQDH